MTRMEELLRAAIHDDSAEIGAADVRPLELDVVRYSRHAAAARHLRHWRPAFAAAAVVVIVALSLTLSQVLPGGKPRPGVSPHPSTSPPSTIVPDTVPAYYAAVTATKSPAYRSPQNVTIRDTYTAAVLATVRPPAGYGTFAFVTGTGRPGTWLAGAQHPAAAASSAQPVKLFLLTYDAGSRQVTVRPLPPPPMRDAAPMAISLVGSAPTGLAAEALSPDGAMLAIIVAKSDSFDVRVYTLASGSVRTWSAPAPATQPGDWEFSLTWLDDNRTLAVGAADFAGIKSAPAWYLDTSAPGGELAAASRTVTLSFPKAKPSTSFNGPHTPDSCGLPVATSDGQLLLCSGTASFPLNAAGATSAGIWVFSARTGRLTAALEQHTICCMLMSTDFPRIVWVSPKGDVLIATGITDTNHGTQLFVRAPDGRLTQLPWPGGIIHYPGIGNPFEPSVAW